MARPQALRPRKLPRQARARATVEAVLDAAAALLREVGVDRLTTNAIADRAGVNVASLYKYFPNKFAVLAALWARMQAKQQGLLDALEEATDLPSAVDAGVDATLAFVLREPGFVELADAVRMLPQLRDLGRRAHADAAILLRELLARRGDMTGAAGEEIDAMSAVIVETVSAVLAHARRASPARRKEIVAELKRMLTAYLVGVEASSPDQRPM